MGNLCKSYDFKELQITNQENNTIKDRSKDSPRNELKEIKEYRKEIIKMNVFKRREIAENEYNKYIKENNNDPINLENDKIKEKYIKIMILVLIDDTNKNIIKMYLNFLKKYSNFIKDELSFSYEREINKYKTIFTIDELKEIEKNIKNKSEKQAFFDYIKYLSQLDVNNMNEIEKVFTEAKEGLENLFLFNNPINFDNKELYFYKSYYNLLNEISKNDYGDKKEYLNNKKNVMQYVIKKSIFENNEINNNEDKMNLLNLYILKENFKINYNEDELINFNRLIQPMPINKEDFINFIENKKIKYENDLNKGRNNIEYVVHQVKLNDDIKVMIPLEKVCINNLNNKNLDNNMNPKLYYNLDTLLLDNEISSYIKDIKHFLIRIIDSKVYNQLIKKLFPDYYQYLIYNNNEDIKTYIKERIKFYPFQDLDLSGITDKLSCYTFIPTINFINSFRVKNEDSYKVGLTIINSYHEINHTNQSLIFFKGNDKNLINTPEREGDEFHTREGGENFECLLFGKTMENINLFQSLYLLNENNYEQNLDEFRENFKNITSIVIKTNGNTNFIKNEDGIFNYFYKDNIDEVSEFIKKFNKDLIYQLPIIFIGKLNKRNENINYYKKRCGLLGGKK